FAADVLRASEVGRFLLRAKARVLPRVDGEAHHDSEGRELLPPRMGSFVMTDDRYFLLKALAEAEALTDLNVRMLQAFMDRWEMTAYHAILHTNLISEADLADAIARHFGLNRLFHCETLPIEIEVLAMVPFAQARAWECLPVNLTETTARRLEI